MCKIGTIKHLKASVLSSQQLWLLDNFVNFFASRPCNCLLFFSLHKIIAWDSLKKIMWIKMHLRIVEARLGSLEKGVVDLPPGVTQ